MFIHNAYSELKIYANFNSEGNLDELELLGWKLKGGVLTPKTNPKLKPGDKRFHYAGRNFIWESDGMTIVSSPRSDGMPQFLIVPNAREQLVIVGPRGEDFFFSHWFIHKGKLIPQLRAGIDPGPTWEYRAPNGDIFNSDGDKVASGKKSKPSAEE